MRTGRVVVLVLGLIPALFCGCQEAPAPKPRGFFPEGHPATQWEVKTAANPTGTVRPAPKPETKPEYVDYKPDTEIVSPILNASGKWTIRLAFYHPDPQRKLSALYYANNHARALLKQGYEAYVTDIISLAIVSVGNFNDEHDPELLKTWGDAYDAWLKLHGGQESKFRQQMETFYGDKTVFGDQPWPVSIVDLQVKMKGAYKMPVTEEDKRRYQEYLKRGEK